MQIIQRLAKLQADMFIADNESYMRSLPVVSVPQSILVSFYEILVAAKKILSLENMPRPEQESIWEMAKEFAAGRLNNNEKMKRLCRCLIAIEYLLK